MKISLDLPQFSKKTALLIEAGEQDADFFIAQNGEISRAAFFRIAKPKYPDRAGKSIRRGRGRIFSAGAFYENDKNWMLKEFVRELKKYTKEMMLKYKASEVYIYAPPHLMKQIKSAILPVLKGSYAMSFRGNYHGQHPFEFLKMIMRRQTRRAARRRVMPTKSEAVKILRRQ